MAKELIGFGTRGTTCYFALINSVGQFRRVDNNTWELYNSANRANYIISATQQGGSPVFMADMPGGVAAGVYYAPFFQRVVGNGSNDIELDLPMVVPVLEWDGAAAVYLASRLAAASYSAAPTAVQVRQEIDANSTKLDATISSRSSHTAADVWAVGSRTLTSFGTLVSDIWNAATRTLTAIGDSAGVTTLLGRLTNQRATNLDNLTTAPPDAATIAAAVVNAYDEFYISSAVQAAPAPSPSAFAGDSGLLATDGAYTGSVVFVTGANAGLARAIVSYSSARLFTTEAFPVAPNAGDQFKVIGA